MWSVPPPVAPLPVDVGVCQFAAVGEVAVRTCPAVGAVAADTLTTVVAEFNALVALEVPPMLKFATGVVDATVKGAVPDGIVDSTVVNLPVDAVVAPTDVLFIVPAVAGLIVTVPVPVGLRVTLALRGDAVKDPGVTIVVDREKTEPVRSIWFDVPT